MCVCVCARARECVCARTGIHNEERRFVVVELAVLGLFDVFFYCGTPCF